MNRITVGPQRGAATGRRTRAPSHRRAAELAETAAGYTALRRRAAPPAASRDLIRTAREDLRR